VRVCGKSLRLPPKNQTRRSVPLSTEYHKRSRAFQKMSRYPHPRSRGRELRPSGRGRGVRLVHNPGASSESQLQERSEIGPGSLPRPRATLSSTRRGRPFARLDHVRYERDTDYLDELVVRRRLFRRKLVLPFEAVAAVDGKNKTVLLRIKP
jgi:hypothetical protein